MSPPLLKCAPLTCAIAHVVREKNKGKNSDDFETTLKFSTRSTFPKTNHPLPPKETLSVQRKEVSVRTPPLLG